ncbi:hypothetical protein WG622_02610 [Cognatishimia sp. D5M38]|uniref:Uncharacterized protein n=1 Tax=Cognatishimia coralii TaxID=3083254 RepID=A0ABU8QCH2_9RHOB
MGEMTYVGRRIVKAGLKHCFIEGHEEDKLTFYPKVKASRFAGAIIGATYKFEDDRIPTIWGKCQLGMVDGRRKLEWELEDRLSVEENKQRNLDPSGELTDVIARLRFFRFRLNGRSRALFDTWLLRELSK